MRCAVVLGVVLDGPILGAQVANPDAPERVRLIFDEQQIPDAVRAQLYDLIALSVPESQWPTVKVAERTSIPALLNDYFDIFSSGLGSAPNSFKMLRDLVSNANRPSLLSVPGGALAAGEVRIPPVPVRAFTSYRLGVLSRSFDPRSMTYALKSREGVTEERQTEEPPRVGTPSSNTVRRGRITDVVISLTDAVLEKLRRYRGSLGSVIAVDADGDGFTTISLLAPQPNAVCDSAATWLSGSPYRASMKQAMTPKAVEQITAAAANLPLTVIDWNVNNDPKGHGTKVRAVVTEVLERLGLRPLDVFVKTFELNPRRNRGELGVVLKAYKAQLVQPGPDLAAAFTGAEDWIKNHVPADEYALTQRVPSLVLQAVLWSHFRRAQALNFSFTTDSQAIKVIDPASMFAAKGFGAFAAGNTGMPVSPRQLPQAEASQWPNVVNVTHGKPDGVIQGDISNEEKNIFVNLVAPGCGFTTPPLNTSDTGSSFASPYVLTAAWVRMLQGTPPVLLKRALISASQPLSVIGRRVESGGLFDPALLFLQPGAHVVTTSGEFVPLTSLSFEMTYTVDGDDVRVSNSKSTDRVITFHACPGSTALCTTDRRWTSDGRLRIETGLVVTLSLDAASGARKLSPSDAAALLREIRLIAF